MLVHGALLVHGAWVGNAWVRTLPLDTRQLTAVLICETLPLRVHTLEFPYVRDGVAMLADTTGSVILNLTDLVAFTFHIRAQVLNTLSAQWAATILVTHLSAFTVGIRFTAAFWFHRDFFFGLTCTRCVLTHFIGITVFIQFTPGNFTYIIHTGFHIFLTVRLFSTGIFTQIVLAHLSVGTVRCFVTSVKLAQTVPARFPGVAVIVLRADVVAQALVAHAIVFTLVIILARISSGASSVLTVDIRLADVVLTDFSISTILRVFARYVCPVSSCDVRRHFVHTFEVFTGFVLLAVNICRASFHLTETVFITELSTLTLEVAITYHGHTLAVLTYFNLATVAV